MLFLYSRWRPPYFTHLRSAWVKSLHQKWRKLGSLFTVIWRRIARDQPWLKNRLHWYKTLGILWKTTLKTWVSSFTFGKKRKRLVNWWTLKMYHHNIMYFYSCLRKKIPYPKPTLPRIIHYFDLVYQGIYSGGGGGGNSPMQFNVWEHWNLLIPLKGTRISFCRRGWACWQVCLSHFGSLPFEIRCFYVGSPWEYYFVTLRGRTDISLTRYYVQRLDTKLFLLCGHFTHRLFKEDPDLLRLFPYMFDQSSEYVMKMDDRVKRKGLLTMQHVNKAVTSLHDPIFPVHYQKTSSFCPRKLKVRSLMHG